VKALYSAQIISIRIGKFFFHKEARSFKKKIMVSWFPDYLVVAAPRCAFLWL
jgi:hypothetical protein